MNSSSYWSKSGKERRRPRQNCYHRLGQYEETQYTLLQDSCDGHSGGAYPLQSQKSEHIFERELEPGDTLLTLSLQFNCPVPQTEIDWLRIERGFSGIWNFSHCVGAIDGKHVVLQAPPSSGSHYYNYKGTHSIILLAAVDANYMFTYFDVGSNGQLSDGVVYVNSSLYPAITNDLLDILKPIPLPGREVDCMYL